MLRLLTLSKILSIIVIGSLVLIPAAMATSPKLGAVESYSVLAGSQVTNTGITRITGNAGVSPGISTPRFSGFPPGVVGPPGVIHDMDTNAGLAQAANTAAFGALSAGPNEACDVTYPDVKELAGLTLVPGVYCFTSSVLLSTGVPLTLDGQGSTDSVWIFRMASTLVTTPGVNARVLVTNSGLPCNVWWQVGSSATFGAGTRFVGNVMALTSISLGTGARVEGRLLAQTGEVTLDTNIISPPNCSATAVELLYFRVARLNSKQMRVKWATAVEVDNFGFNLYRARVNNLGQAKLIHFEPAATTGSGLGATYTYLDTLPATGSWWYWLADVDTSGRETFHTPVRTVLPAINPRDYYSMFTK